MRLGFWISKKANLLASSGSVSRIIRFPEMGLDASDSELSSSPRRGTNHIANWPVFGTYLPDAIDSYHVRETA